MNSTNLPYQRMLAHHAEHQFKKGVNKGDAPLDIRQRYGHKLVRIHPTHAEVVLYRSTLFRAFPDGTVQLSAGGWSTYTTKDTINTALALFCRYASPSYSAYVHSCTRYGVTQWHYMVAGAGTYLFYDGMIITPNGIPLEPRPFKRRVIDQTKSRPFTTASCPFRQTLPLLHAALPDTTNARPNDYYAHGLSDPHALAHAITSQPELWPLIVEHHSYPPRIWSTVRKYSDPKEVLQTILREAKKGMHMLVDAPHYII